jgi:Calx-beta domain
MKMKPRTASVVLFLALLPLPAIAQPTLLDTAGDVGRTSSTAIGTDGLALIAYRDFTNGTVKVAHCNDAACTGATLSTVDSGWNTLALVIGGDGRGLIVYSGPNDGGLKAAHCNDVACTTVSVATVEDPSVLVRGHVSVAIGVDGMPLVVFVRAIATPQSIALVAAHCSNATCSSRSLSTLVPLPVIAGASGYDTAVARGTDGRALIAYIQPGAPAGTTPRPLMAHCADVSCTTLTPPPPSARAPLALIPFVDQAARPALVIGADGRGLVAYRRTSQLLQISELHVAHCADTVCSAFDGALTIADQGGDTGLTTSPTGQPWFVRSRYGRILLARCTDVACQDRIETCVGGETGDSSLAWGADGQPLAAFHALPGLDLGIAHDFGPCPLSVMSASDVEVAESQFANGAVVTLSLDRPTETAATVQYTTVRGTAQEGIDYVPLSGTLTFAGCCDFSQVVYVPLLPDTLDEPDEQFRVVFSSPQGATLADPESAVTIVDDDPPPTVGPQPCGVVEGNGAPTTCSLPVALATASGKTATVAYFTVNGTATAGTDYTATSGLLTFAPGVVSQTVAVPVLGDTSVEPDESFALVLASPVNATLASASADGVIVDDDGVPVGHRELEHGSTLTADLAAAPGPRADQNGYRLAQAPYASYEIVLDEASADAAPEIRLERIASDGSTVLQTGTQVGTGTALSLRFQNRLGVPLLGQSIRVGSAACGTACGPDDTYRLRAYETTATIPRFNNSATQATIVVVQNTTDVPVSANLDFWSPAGTFLATAPLTLAPRGLGVVSGPSIPALVAQSGSITITSDGAYGALAGKAVALEPASGFSFDSPLAYKPR